MERKNSSITLRFDYRWLVLVLIGIILVMLVLWQPWRPGQDKDARTVTVTGEATVRAEPDEYLFYPRYSFVGADQSTIQSEATDKSNAVVSALKELGVNDKDIKSSIDNYKGYYPEQTGDYTYVASISITAADKQLAQKIQDYLVTTNPEGAVTPSPTFSDERRKQLEAEARDQATQDARRKADQSAKNLGFRVADVKSVNDGSGFDASPYPMMRESNQATDSAASMSIPLQPGENDLRYSVTVEYYIR